MRSLHAKVIHSQSLTGANEFWNEEQLRGAALFLCCENAAQIRPPPKGRGARKLLTIFPK